MNRLQTNFFFHSRLKVYRSFLHRNVYKNNAAFKWGNACKIVSNKNDKTFVSHRFWKTNEFGLNVTITVIFRLIESALYSVRHSQKCKHIHVTAIWYNAKAVKRNVNNIQKKRTRTREKERMMKKETVLCMYTWMNYYSILFNWLK